MKMLLIVHADRNVSTIAGNLNIGDTAADIYVISPFPSTQSCSLLYRLPNGEEGEPLFSQGVALGGDYGGAVYSFEIPTAFTKYVGNVQVMVSLVDTNGRRFVSDTATFDVNGFETLPFPDGEDQGQTFADQLEAIALSVSKIVTAYENVSGTLNITETEENSVDISVTLDGEQTGVIFTFNLSREILAGIAESLIEEHNKSQAAHPALRDLLEGDIASVREELSRLSLNIGNTTNLMNYRGAKAQGEDIDFLNPRLGDIATVGERVYIYENYYLPGETSVSTGWHPISAYETRVFSTLLQGTNNRVTVCEKQITNLEQGMPADSFFVDNSVAYRKAIPPLACSYALLESVDPSVTSLKIQGSNMMPPDDEATAVTRNGVTFTPIGEGGIHISGLSDRQGAPYITLRAPGSVYLPAGRYYVGNLIGGVYLEIRGANQNNYSIYATNVTYADIPEGWYGVRLYVSAVSTTQYNTDIYPMLNRVSSSFAFEPYEVKEIQISDISTADKYIEVEQGGIITFENPTSADVASTIVYQLRGV